MNNYEEVYKYKREHTESLPDELSSLNNNYSVCEMDMNPDQNQKIFEESKEQNWLEYELSNYNEDFNLLNNQSDSINQGSSTCIWARCQKDIRIGEDRWAQFWIKNNKLSICHNLYTDTNSVNENFNFDQDWVPLELDFSFTYSLENESKIQESDRLKQQLDEIESWAKSLANIKIDGEVSEFSSQINTKDANTKSKVETHEEFDLFEEIKEDNKAKIEVKTHENVNSKYGFEYKSYASQFNWSQHQSFYEALEGKVESSTITKSSSDKEINALSIRRSWFRALSSYYKNTFSKFNRAWQEKRRNKKKTKNMNELIDTYILKEFGDLLRNCNQELIIRLREAMIAILHSHRYKKQEEFTKDIDFSIIRDVLYSYTLVSRDRFINDTAYAFIYHHFFVNGGYKFLNSKVHCKTTIYVFELEKELVSLHNDSIKTIN